MPLGVGASFGQLPSEVKTILQTQVHGLAENG